MEGRFPCTAVWEHVDPAEGLHFVRVVMRYAERVRGESLEVLRELVAPFLDGLVDRLGRAQMEDRALIVQVLGTLGLAEHKETVIRGLDDPSPLVSMVAARAMARYGDPSHAGQVLDRIARYSNWSRGYLAAMLASMGPDAAPTLRALYADSEREPWVRAVAADALRWLNDLPAREIARSAIGETSNREVLAQSLRLLSRVGDPGDLPAVMALMGSDDSVVRATAIQALGQLGSTEHGPLVRAAVDDGSSWVSFHAAHALGALSRRDLLEELAVSEHPRAVLAQQVLREQRA
jgi:HEAT repeat protein